MIMIEKVNWILLILMVALAVVFVLTIRNEPERPMEKSEYNQFSQDCPCGAHLSGPYKGDGYKFVCARCGREYSYRWQGEFSEDNTNPGDGWTQTEWRETGGLSDLGLVLGPDGKWVTADPNEVKE